MIWIVLIGFLAFTRDVRAEKEISSYGVALSSLQLMAFPDEDADVLSVIPEGAVVGVLHETGGWLKVVFDNRQGFVLELPGSLEIIDSVQSKKLGDPALSESSNNSLKRHIENRKMRIGAIVTEENALVEELHETEKLLNAARRQIGGLKEDLAELDVTIRKTQQDISEVEKSVAALEKAAGKKLVLSYKLTRLGSLGFFASSDSLTEMFKRKYALDKLIGHDEQMFEVLSAQQIMLEKLLASANAQKTEKQLLDQELVRKQKILSGEREKRERFLDRIGQEKTMAIAALDSLHKAETSLNQTLEAFRRIDPENQSAEAMPRNFHQAKGLLILPVRGKIITAYGHYRHPVLKTESVSRGIDIKADLGEPVRAVASGNVIYSKWLKGYGNLMIIEHGAHFHTVYAHAQELFKEKGDPVQSGEVIATVGDCESWNGPMLHFEIRQNGQPINPVEWFKKGKGNEYAHQ
jgi:septal ring factor EnvC (AmiA/AmiB activator)